MKELRAMLIAVSEIDPIAAFACYLAAFILFILAAFNVPARVGLMALGLALVTIPPMWNALAAA